MSTKITPRFYLQSHPSSEPGPQIPSCSLTPPLVPQACPTQHVEPKPSFSLPGHSLAENGSNVCPVAPNLGPSLPATSPQMLTSHHIGNVWSGHFQTTSGAPRSQATILSTGFLQWPPKPPHFHSAPSPTSQGDSSKVILLLGLKSSMTSVPLVRIKPQFFFFI